MIGTARMVTLVGAVVLSLGTPSATASTLAGYWHLDEGAGVIAGDKSGNGNAGTVSGAAWVPGRFKSALAFDGVDDAVLVPNSPTLEPTNVTLEAWVKRLGSPGAFKHILAKGAHECNAASYALYSGADGGLQFYVADGLSFTLSPDAGQGVWNGAWHHVAGTFDGAAVRLFVDGTEVGSGTPTALSIGYGLATTNDFLVGAYRGTCAEHDFQGALDEPRVWARALGSAELAASAAMGAGSANELSQQDYGADFVVFTSHFKKGSQVTISLESSSGLRTIGRVAIDAVSPKGSSAACGGKPCPVTLSNEGRTASLAVTGSASNVRLRVTLDNGATFTANVKI